MRTKKKAPSARRGPGRPRKKTTTTPPKAAKKRRGRPRKNEASAKAAAKSTANRVSKAAQSLAKAAKNALFGSVHGLARWVPEKGDVLITKTAGAFQLGNSSWRKAKDIVLPQTVTAKPKAKAEHLAQALQETAEAAPVKRRRGRPRKVRLDDSQGVIPIKGHRTRRNVEESTLDEIDSLNGKLRQVVRGEGEKKAQ